MAFIINEIVKICRTAHMTVMDEPTSLLLWADKERLKYKNNNNNRG